MKLVDVHAHLDFPEFEKDLPEVLERAEKAGVKHVICQGVHHESNVNVLKLAKKFPVCKAALGIYPLNPKNVKVDDEYNFDFDRSSEKAFEETLEFIKSKKEEIVAIGEVGIDLKFSTDEKQQVKNFENIIALSEKIKKPLIIHSRKAESLILDILESSSIKEADLHCFSGKKKLVKRAVDLGLTFSIPANVVRSPQFQMNVELIPITQMLTETDAPYLSPEPGRRCEPRDVLGAVKKIAEIKKMDVEEAANNIFMNYQRLFG